MRVLITLIISSLLLLGGCSFKVGDDLLQAPKASKDYIALQNELDVEVSKGSVFATPQSGTNRNNVQLIDIDGDAEEEAVAFFRDSTISGEFNVIIYNKENEEYVEIGRIAGIGNNIDLVEYPMFSPIGGGGIAVSWMISNEVERGLTVGLVQGDTVATVLDTTYISHLIYDIDGDSIEEVFIINKPQDKYVLNMYKIDGQTMKLESSTYLSDEVDTISRITTGELQSGLRAIAIDSRVRNATGIVTDLVTINEKGGLENLTIDKDTTSSIGTYRAVNSYTTKIYSNNLLYIPTVTPMQGFDENDLSTISYVTTWSLYDYYNATESDLFTYHNSAEGWFFELDEQNKDKITILRDSISNVKVTTFYYYINEWRKDELFTVYTIPLAEYDAEEFSEGYIYLGENSTSVFIGENLDSSSISDEEINNDFRVINTYS